jgi:hypothetical protein
MILWFTAKEAERTREIGIRIALGAGARDVLALVVRQALWLIGIGDGNADGKDRQRHKQRVFTS